MYTTYKTNRLRLPKKTVRHLTPEQREIIKAKYKD